MNGLLGADTKAVLFDWDDTLVATIEAKWAQHKHIALNRYNKVLLDEEIKQQWGKPLQEIFRLLYAGEDVQGALDYMIELDDQGLFPKKLYDQTIGVLEQLRLENILVGVVTAHLKIGFDRDLKALGIPAALFDYVQTSDVTPVHKPDPEVFTPAKDWLATQNIEASQVVYVGDAWTDMQAAAGAGFKFIAVDSGLVSAEAFKSKNVTVISELKALVA